MSSTYTTRLRLEKQGDGENPNTWGQKLNQSVIDLVDDSIAGYVTVSSNSADITLTTGNGSTDESRNSMIQVNGVLSQNIDVIIPGQEKSYIGFNNTSGSFSNWLKNTKPARGITSAFNYLTDNPIVAPLIAGVGSIANRYNPLKEGSQNYNPYLEEQIDILRSPGEFQYLSGDDPSGPYRITGGPLAGKNLVSGFGTNDYGRMLDKRIEYFKARKNRTDEQTRKMHETIAERKRIEEEKLRNELKKEQAARPYAPDVGSGGGQSGITSTTTASQASRMGGGSRQAKSGSQKSGGSGRTDSGWGW